MSDITLAELCTLVAQQVDPQASPNDLYIGLEHVESGRLTCESGGLAGDVQSSKFRFQANDVLYGKLRPYLDKAVLAEADGVCTTELLVLRPKPDVDARYLAALVHSPQFIEHAVAGTTGAQHPRTSWHHISDFAVERLKLTEQSQFAELVWIAHRALRASEAALTCAQDLKRATLRELFRHGLRCEAQKESEIGPLPDSWHPTAIEQLAKVKGGKRMPKGVSLTAEDTGRPYIRVTDFDDHSVRTEGLLFVPRGYEDVIARYRISCRDVYISIAGSIGIVGQVPTSLDDANLTENAAKLVIERNDVSARFLMHALASDCCQEQISMATAKNAQPKLALTRIEQILIPMPPTLDEQLEINAVLGAVDTKIDLHKRKNELLEELFRALLNKLMTGEIRLAELDLSALKSEATA